MWRRGANLELNCNACALYAKLVSKDRRILVWDYSIEPEAQLPPSLQRNTHRPETTESALR